MKKSLLFALFLISSCGHETEEDRLQDELNDGFKEFALLCEKTNCATQMPKPYVAKLLDPNENHYGWICWTAIYTAEPNVEKIGIAVSPGLLKNKNPKNVIYEKTLECLAWLGRSTMSFSDFTTNANSLTISDSN